MKILFLEPFFGGSHKDFATGLSAHSRHDITLLTLAPEYWRWRMRTASLNFLQKIKRLKEYDLVFATDMMDVAQFRALSGPDCPPVVLYFHENQLSYPLSSRAKQRKPDVDAGLIHLNSALASDQVWFNSNFHLTLFEKELRRLVKQIPAPRPTGMVDRICEKSRVVYPGCRFPATSGPVPSAAATLTPPLIIWNHRWEYDKQPDLFFKVLMRLKKRGIAFSLAVLGERYELYPEVFDRARGLFEKEMVAFGYEPCRTAYEAWLGKGRVVVSTAVQENFGISVVEAVRFGCFPVLPRRLSYPELIPEPCHDAVFYRTEHQLVEKLTHHLQPGNAFAVERNTLAAHMRPFSWELQAPLYDDLLETLSRS
jgi:glycosyltransferase involved in cell wall biosynthesis